MAQLIQYTKCTTQTQQEIQAALLHWYVLYNDTNSASFDAWAAVHAFYINKNGTLSQRHTYCETME